MVVPSLIRRSWWIVAVIVANCITTQNASASCVEHHIPSLDAKNNTEQPAKHTPCNGKDCQRSPQRELPPVPAPVTSVTTTFEAITSFALSLVPLPVSHSHAPESTTLLPIAYHSSVFHPPRHG
jgi:hypothetical protein